MEVISCHGASQDGPKKLSRFMREVTLARIMKNSCVWSREAFSEFQILDDYRLDKTFTVIEILT